MNMQDKNNKLIDYELGADRTEPGDVPLWHKSCLTLSEGAKLFGIGINRLRKVTDKHPELVIWVNTKRLIKRAKMCSFLDNAVSL